MDHLAILSKKRKLLSKILSKEKRIESRWYKFRKPPVGCIASGDTIYFKETGDPVSAKAKVEKVISYKNLNPKLITEIIRKHGELIGINLDFLDSVKEKRFCTLIFLKQAQKIKPFKIDKRGYGLMNAWISVPDISVLKRNC